MTKIICDINLGHSPRTALLRDFNIAYANGDFDAVLALLSDNIKWEMVGHKTFEGKAAVSEMLAGMGDASADEMEIQHIITHGAQAACDGIMRYPDGSVIAFCDVYDFVSASKNSIKAIKSYAVDLKQQG